MTVKGTVESAVFDMNKSCDTWTSLNAFPTKLNDGIIKIENAKYKASRKIRIWEDKKITTGPAKATVDSDGWEQFWNFFENTDTYFTPSTYKNVKNNKDWQRLYHVAPRPIFYGQPNADLAVAPAIIQTMVAETIFCKKCNILLPLSSITVDHQKAQTGGGGAAIEKLFKACSLSRYESKGRKGKFFGVAGKNPGFDLMINDSMLPSIGDFTWMGVIFYSLITAAKQVQKFEEVCINHALNLQPMCASCNSSKGNWAFV